jgi:hypothetical protein
MRFFAWPGCADESGGILSGWLQPVQGEARATLVHAPSTVTRFESRPWPYAWAVATSTASWKRWRTCPWLQKGSSLSAGRRDVLNAISKDAAMAVIKSIYQNVAHDIDLQAD